MTASGTGPAGGLPANSLTADQLAAMISSSSHSGLVEYQLKTQGETLSALGAKVDGNKVSADQQHADAMKAISELPAALAAANAATYLRQDLYRSDQAAVSTRFSGVEADLTAIKGRTDWIWKTVLGAIITTIVGALVAYLITTNGGTP